MKVLLVGDPHNSSLKRNIQLYIDKNVDKKTTKKMKLIYQNNNLNFTQATQNVRMADILICEGSREHIMLGFSIATAIQLRCPIICLVQDQGQLAYWNNFQSCDLENMQLIHYTDRTLFRELSLAFDYAFTSSGLRFNFILPPTLLNYLGWVAKYHQLPKSVYLRRLIEKDLKQHNNFFLNTENNDE